MLKQWAAIIHSNVPLGKASQKLSCESRNTEGKAKANMGSPWFQELQLQREAAGHRQVVGGVCRVDLGKSQTAHFPSAEIVLQKANLGTLTCCPSLLIPNILGERWDDCINKLIPMNHTVNNFSSGNQLKRLHVLTNCWG